MAELNVRFSVKERLIWAWRVFRYPYALRNSLHFVQEAGECLDAIGVTPSGIVEIVPTAGWMVKDAREELGKSEELLRFLQDYSDG